VPDLHAYHAEDHVAGPLRLTGETRLYTFQASTACTVVGKAARKLEPTAGSGLPELFS